MNDRNLLQALLLSFERQSAVAIREDSREISYPELVKAIACWQGRLEKQGIKSQKLVAIKSDYHIDAIALLLALLANGNTVALLPATASGLALAEYVEDAQTDYLFSFDNAGEWQLETTGTDLDKHPLLLALQQQQRPGFIIFSSGSSGRAKAILHDANDFLQSFVSADKPLRTLAFLLFDHIAGLDTLFYTLHSGGTLILAKDRSTHTVCSLIEKTTAQVLPTSPSFLNLLYLSGDYQAFDLSSLEIVTLGSEPMSESGLARASVIFPGARIIQKYGASEFGSPRSKSRGDANLWLKIDSNNFAVKVVDHILWVKSASTMLGYLNFPQPLMEDGYYCTGDRVEVDGQWLRILGRSSDMINVGGEKVFPAEVEAVLLEMPAVEDALVHGEPNPLLGNLVSAKVKPSASANYKGLKQEVRKYCLSRLDRFKVPAKIEIVDQSLTNERFKRSRG